MDYGKIKKTSEIQGTTVHREKYYKGLEIMVELSLNQDLEGSKMWLVS